MFTGIIETFGIVEEVESEGLNKNFLVGTSIAGEIKVDQSISHNGVCLTVTKLQKNSYWTTAIHETLTKSNLGHLKKGDRVNLERCMIANGRFDGHVVQGHVDQTGKVRSIVDQEGSWLFEFEYDPSQGNVTVEKGSIAVNGISLTCFNSRVDSFTVAIIPYTFTHTNIGQLKVGDTVNLEFDIIGKYVKRLLTGRSSV
ncbi:MAG: riboflavin synthase [Bacteroidota bacterium]